MSEEKAGDLKRVIGFWGGTALIIGVTIGSGIFRKPYTLAKDLHDPVVILGLWGAFGIISLFGALALAELCSLLPRTGGAYVFLRAAYGDTLLSHPNESRPLCARVEPVGTRSQPHSVEN